MNIPMPLLIRGDARHLPLADNSVDLIVTSPPYYGLRSYTDGGKHYDGQIGSEPTWQEYLDVLIDCTREWIRVLKPTGSIWLNMGDKFVSDNRGSGTETKRGAAKYAPAGPAGFAGNGSSIRQKSLMLLPHRYAIRCVDDLGLIVRMDQVWKKDNGLPESVTDRTRREHEYLFHMVKQRRYYSAVDEIREPHQRIDEPRPLGTRNKTQRHLAASDHTGWKDHQVAHNPLGALPGSVWSVPSQPLNVPDHISHTRCCGGRKRKGCQDGLDHYAAFPFALVRPIILGWSPRLVCTACGQGRRPVVEGQYHKLWNHTPKRTAANPDNNLQSFSAKGRGYVTREIVGQECDCANVSSPTTPGVVLDPFGGTGSAALVAAMNGRTGISMDASWDYCDVLARWRINDPKERARAAGLDPDAVARIPIVDERQGSLLDLLGSGVVSP